MTTKEHVTIEALQQMLEEYGKPNINAGIIEGRYHCRLNIVNPIAGSLEGAGSGTSLQGALLNAFEAVKRDAAKRRAQQVPA